MRLVKVFTDLDPEIFTGPIDSVIEALVKLKKQKSDEGHTHIWIERGTSWGIEQYRVSSSKEGTPEEIQIAEYEEKQREKKERELYERLKAKFGQ